MDEEKKKVIYFCVDSESFIIRMTGNHEAVGYTDYLHGRRVMNMGVTPMVTTQLALMTFYQIGDYEAYICYRNKAIKIEEGMELAEGYTLTKPTYSDDADLLDTFIMGYFNELLGIKNK